MSPHCLGWRLCLNGPEADPNGARAFLLPPSLALPEATGRPRAGSPGAGHTSSSTSGWQKERVDRSSVRSSWLLCGGSTFPLKNSTVSGLGFGHDRIPCLSTQHRTCRERWGLGRGGLAFPNLPGST